MISGPVLVILWAVLGWLAGGLIAWLAIALPAARGFQALAPRCVSCGEKVGLLRTHFVFQTGDEAESCPHCQAPLREPWPRPELAAALVMAAMAARFGLGWPLVVYSLAGLVLVLITFIDMRHKLILDVLSLPTLLAALAVGAASGGLAASAIGMLAAGGGFLLFFVMAQVIYRRPGALGLGDVKLAAMIGALLRWPLALNGIVYAAVLGGILAVVWMAAGKSRRDVMPYGPALTLGAILIIILHPSIWH